MKNGQIQYEILICPSCEHRYWKGALGPESFVISFRVGLALPMFGEPNFGPAPAQEQELILAVYLDQLVGIMIYYMKKLPLPVPLIMSLSTKSAMQHAKVLV